MSKTRFKISASDRKEAILSAAAPIFARLGREGATTKELAKAAGISEALLYKHFSGKDALYAELERHCVDAVAVGSRMLTATTPCTETLVIGVAVLVQAVFIGIGPSATHDDTKRLVTSSLLGDGHFARAFLDRHVKPWIGVLRESLQVAKAAGDVDPTALIGHADLWFVHHLANTLHLIVLSDADVVDYGMSPNELQESAIRFLLRGLGLKSEAIERHYEPETLKREFGKPAEENP